MINRRMVLDMNKNDYAPLVIFVYARLDHTEKLMECLKKNKDINKTDVWIFSDGYKKKTEEEVKKVRKYIHSLENNNNFKSLHIVESETNQGLAKSVIKGVTEIINLYGKVIVLEDDLIISEKFIQYMNNALKFYCGDARIWSISGYQPKMTMPKYYKKDIYLSYRGCSWGWATWKDRWMLVDWDVHDYRKFKYNYLKRKKLNRGGSDMANMLDRQMDGDIDSWAIRWCYEQSKLDMFTIYPTKSLVSNEGHDGTGTHGGVTQDWITEISDDDITFEKEIQLDLNIAKEFKKVNNIGLVSRIKSILLLFNLRGLVNFAKRIANK